MSIDILMHTVIDTLLPLLLGSTALCERPVSNFHPCEGETQELRTIDIACIFKENHMQPWDDRHKRET